MCGIAGFTWKNEKIIWEMLKRMKHRGPDDEGIYVDDKVTLGHVRLSILDLSPNGHQPMISQDGALVIVHNGEIYNYKELKKDLKAKGYKFRSETDTEVILYAYKEWGPNCVRRFNGMWAFVIYDKENKLLFMSRDRFGIKPLYYYYDGKNLIFSSEIKGIFVHSIKPLPNDEAIFDFLYYNEYDHKEHTFFSNIMRILPGYNAIFDLTTHKLIKIKYYDLKNSLKQNTSDNKKFKDLFFKSIKRRLTSDVPVGSCLSGGLDSSSIVCGMRQIKQDIEIKTFSLVFPNEKIDESKYQKVVTKSCNVKNYTTTFTAGDVLRDLYDLIDTQEEPFTSLSIYGQYRVMKLARENGMKVLLDGQGSDEMLAGYHYFFAYYYYELLKQLKLTSLLKEIVQYYRKTKSFKAIQYFIGLFLPQAFQKYIIEKNTLVSKDFIRIFKDKSSLRLKRKTLNEALVDAILYNIPHLLRFEDKNAMRWSIETRVPFLDHELVEYVLSTPSDNKIKNGMTKSILRESLRGIVPQEILNRTDKIGFATPDKQLAYSEVAKDFIWKIINSESFKGRKYWDWKKVHKTFNKKKSNKIFVGEVIWKVVITEIWLRRWIDGG